MSRNHRLPVLALTLIMVAAAVVSWYGLVSWGWYAAYVSARIGTVPNSQLGNARLHGTLMFSLLLAGQFGIMLATGFLFRQYAKFQSRAIAICMSVATGVGIDSAVFALLFAYQSYVFQR